MGVRSKSSRLSHTLGFRLLHLQASEYDEQPEEEEEGEEEEKEPGFGGSINSNVLPKGYEYPSWNKNSKSG